LRYAELKKNTDNYLSLKQGFINPFIRFIYNAVFWVFVVPFIFSMNYSTGFIVFSVILFIRLIINLVLNNILKLRAEQYERFPFRIP